MGEAILGQAEDAPPGSAGGGKEPGRKVFAGRLERGLWSLIDQLVVSGGAFLGVVVMARVLPPDSYGVFAILFGAMLMLQLANATLIYHPLSVRLPVTPEPDQPAMIGDSTLLAGIMALMMCVPQAIALWALGLGELVLPATAAFLAWQAQESMRRGFLCSFRLREVLPGDALRYLGQGFGILALAWLDVLTLETALWTIAGASALACALQSIQLRLRGTTVSRLKDRARDFWSIGGFWTLGGGLLMHFRVHFLPIALAFFHGPAAAAGFQAVLNVINLLNPITLSLGNIIPQAVSQSRHKGLAAAWATAKSYGAIGLGPILGYGVLTLALPATLLSIFYGGDSPYAALGLSLQLLMIGLTLSFLSDVFNCFLHGVVAIRSAFVITALGTIATVIAAVPLVYAYGVEGACLAYVIANLTRLAASLIARRRVISRDTAAAPLENSRSAQAQETQPMIVSVVTPTLNALDYLPACVESLKANATPGVEIEHVIVDGGSTDGTVEWAREQGLVVLTGKDKGIFDAINKGSFNSRGELIGFLGADDIMLPGGMKAIVDAYRRSNRRWVVGGIRWIDEKGDSLGDLAALPEWMTPRMISCLGWNPVMHMATYFNREFFTELNGYNIEFKDAGDYEMFMRAMSIEPYERVSTRIAAFRRTGQNNSLLQVERMKFQKKHVLEVNGPKSPLERAFWKIFMKVWVNAANPGWVYVKIKQGLQARFGLRSGGHFAKAAG